MRTGHGEPQDVRNPRGGGGPNGRRAWPDWSSAHLKSHHWSNRACTNADELDEAVMAA